jgi:hypothetical protein
MTKRQIYLDLLDLYVNLMEQHNEATCQVSEILDKMWRSFSGEQQKQINKIVHIQNKNNKRLTT